MPIKYDDHAEVLILLGDVQGADKDNREEARDADHFINKKDGMWDPGVLNDLGDRPHFTFDLTSPIVRNIVGEVVQSDFNVKVRPAGGDATKEVAKTLDGLIRNIENISNADNTYNSNTRAVVTKGCGGWRIIQDWVNSDTFDQDLLIENIPNFENTCWIDYASQMQDASDAKWAFVLKAMPVADYDAKWPKGSGESVSDSRTNEVYYTKPDQVIVGEFLYIKPVNKVIHLMSNGATYEDDAKFKQVKDELKLAGHTIEKSRTRKVDEVKTRLFDGGGWLGEEQDTAFRMIPIIPMYGEYEISENKAIWRGAVSPLMDQQRVFNYSASRDIEEGALAPRAKYWATPEQIAPYKDTIETLNTNSDALQLYKHIDNVPMPQWSGGAQVNPGLQATMSMSSNLINSSAGLFSANQGANPGLQSGSAIEKQINQGNTAIMGWFQARQVAICRTGQILVDTIPRVYDSKRQVRILGENGDFEMVTLHDMVPDQQTQELVELNNLSQGVYDVTCDIGAAFKNRQQEAIDAILEQAKIDPSVLQIGSDIMLSNNQAPGMDILAERDRALKLKQGVIPEDQWTDEEKQKAAEAAQLAAQQPQQPDALMVAAQAEQTKAEAAMGKVQIDAQKVQLEGQRNQVAMAKLQLEGQKDQFEQQKAEFELIGKANQQAADIESQGIDDLNKKIQGLVNIISGFGIDAVGGQAPMELLRQQGLIVDEAQDNLN